MAYSAGCLVGTLIRGRGASNKMSLSELTQYRRDWFRRQDAVRDEIMAQEEQQWKHRTHFHWDPDRLIGVAGSARMWRSVKKPIVLKPSTYPGLKLSCPIPA